MLIRDARRAFATATAFVFVALATTPAYAAGSNMPWEQPLNQILESIQGPVAKIKTGLPLRSQVHGTWVSREKLAASKLKG